MERASGPSPSPSSGPRSSEKQTAGRGALAALGAMVFAVLLAGALGLAPPPPSSEKRAPVSPIAVSAVPGVRRLMHRLYFWIWLLDSRGPPPRACVNSRRGDGVAWEWFHRVDGVEPTGACAGPIVRYGLDRDLSRRRAESLSTWAPARDDAGPRRRARGPMETLRQEPRLQRGVPHARRGPNALTPVWERSYEGLAVFSFLCGSCIGSLLSLSATLVVGVAEVRGSGRPRSGPRASSARFWVSAARWARDCGRVLRPR